MASGKGGHWGRRNQELRSGNRAWMGGIAGRHRSVHTKQKRLKAQPPGLPMGVHKAKLEEGEVCYCGSCNRGYRRGTK